MRLCSCERRYGNSELPFSCFLFKHLKSVVPRERQAFDRKHSYPSICFFFLDYFCLYHFLSEMTKIQLFSTHCRIIFFFHFQHLSTESLNHAQTCTTDQGKLSITEFCLKWHYGNMILLWMQLT